MKCEQTFSTSGIVKFEGKECNVLLLPLTLAHLKQLLVVLKAAHRH